MANAPVSIYLNAHINEQNAPSCPHRLFEPEHSDRRLEARPSLSRLGPTCRPDRLFDLRPSKSQRDWWCDREVGLIRIPNCLVGPGRSLFRFFYCGMAVRGAGMCSGGGRAWRGRGETWSSCAAAPTPERIETAYPTWPKSPPDVEI